MTQTPDLTQKEELLIVYINPLTPMSDQDRISPYNFQYNIKQTNDEKKEKS